MKLTGWWKILRRQPPPPPPEPTPEPIVAAANIFDVLALDGELRQSDQQYRNVLWGREMVEFMLNELHQHIARGDHADPMECDTWCLPTSVSERLDAMTKGQLIVLFVVTFKSHFVLSARQRAAGGDS